jgi:prolyl oligopeptidase
MSYPNRIEMPNLAYPSARKTRQIDTYHGVEVEDPYRWLEDEKAAERADWIAAQSRLTSEYLSGLGRRRELRGRFEELLQYTRYYDLVRRGPYLFFKRTEGTQDWPVLCAQHGLEATPKVLVNPSEAASDGATGITTIAPSRDGNYLAYGLSYRGSDWEEYRVANVALGVDLKERLSWVKASVIAWCGAGFYYSRYPAPSDSRTAYSVRNESHRVYFHQVGTPATADTLVYEDPCHPQRHHFVHSTEDERYVALSVFDWAGGGSGNEIWLLDLAHGKGQFEPLIRSFDSDHRLIDSEGNHLILLTNRGAPNWRVVLVDPRRSQEHFWRDVIPEREDRLEAVTAAAGKLFAVYRVHGAHRLLVFDRTGTLEEEVGMPGIGIVEVYQGQRDDREALWSFKNPTVPPSIYQYDVHRRTNTVFYKSPIRFDPDAFMTTQVSCYSKDGTRVPLFVVHPKDLRLDGSNPLLLQGYGGNGICVGPSFDPFVVALLERGVVYAIACLRGGGEYGEAWHHAGWRSHKQNVFDDCIAAAEWLQAAGYSCPDRSALTGASNGGLLVGAVMVQRPELFKVALPDVGVLDMLRFQRFTMGAAWVAEYGSSEDPAMFPILRAYSPLHNVQAGTSYPATLITTSEYDDRVVPAHSYKFAATLQAKGVGPNPYLIRIGTRSGHGAVNLSKVLDERADVYAFLLAHTAASTT